MNKSGQRRLHIFLLIVFCLGMIPQPVQARRIEHLLDDSLLLMVTAQQRLLAAMPESTTTSALQHTVLPANRPVNEIDIVINLYSSYMGNLQRSEGLTEENIDRLVRGMQGKIKALKVRSDSLNTRRRRSRRGLFGFLRRVGRSIGRVLAKMGRLIGKAAEILVEDILPEVIKNMILTGQPLSADVFWRGVRHVVRNRLKSVAAKALVRKGVPLEILQRAGLPVPGEELVTVLEEDESEEEGEAYATLLPTYTMAPAEEGVTRTPNPDRPERYGKIVLPVNSDGDCDSFGAFYWPAFWTNLPDNYEIDCQPTGQPQLGVFIDDADIDIAFNMTFDLDNRMVSADFAGSQSDDVELTVYYLNTVNYHWRVTDSWIESKGNHAGWRFGGTMVVDLTWSSDLRCFASDYDLDGSFIGCHITWIDKQDTITITEEFYGETFQEGEYGGVYDLEIGDGLEDDVSAYFNCWQCALPAEFPPP